METYLFKAKNPPLYTGLGVLGIISVIITVYYSYKNPGMNIGYLSLLGALIYIFSVILSIRRASKTFRKIVFTDSSIQLTYFNKRKNDLSIAKRNVISQIEDQNITLIERNSNDPIGEILRKNMLDNNQWSQLINSLNNN